MSTSDLYPILKVVVRETSFSHPGRHSDRSRERVRVPLDKSQWGRRGSGFLGSVRPSTPVLSTQGRRGGRVISCFPGWTSTTTTASGVATSVSSVSCAPTFDFLPP